VSADAVMFKYASTDNPPYLRIDISDVKETVSEGTTVSIETSLYGYMQAAVNSVGINADGTKYAIVNLDSEVIRGFGGLSSMLGTDISVTITARAKDTTCLVPASAVRGSTGDRYVFVAEKQSSTFGGTQIKARKQTVTVLNESAETVSVSEELYYSQLIYGEDRAISDGDIVMEAEE